MVEVDYLVHHGILGQKWGVRRYQNLDGSLTKAGKFRQKLNKEQEKYLNKDGTFNEKALKAIKKGFKQTKEDDRINNELGFDRNKDSIIKKGTEINRMTVLNEPIDQKRKYVTLTKNDKENYENIWEQIGIPDDIDFNDTFVGTLTYEATKDLKIKNGKDVTYEILEKYGGTKVKNINNSFELTKNKVFFDQDFDNFAYTNLKGLRDESVGEIMKKYGDKILKDFEKQKYDGIVDPEDMNISEYPVILFNTKDKIKFKQN